MAAQRIGRFVIKKVLGEGAQGIVYQGYDPQLERYVAIKSLHLNQQIDVQTQLDELLKEARAVSKFEHKNIVSIYEAGEDKNKAYLVFEYVEGQLLSEVIKNTGQLEVNKAVNIIRAIVQGIAHAHEHDVVHCDLKPANILINTHNIPKVMDFGIARMLQQGEVKSDNFAGTPRYCAPEYLTENIVGKANDVFSLGLIFYELLTGKRVFNGKKLQEVLNQVLYQKVVLPSQYNDAIDEQLEHIIMRMLDRDRTVRYQDAKEIEQALAEYIDINKDILQIEESTGNAALDFLLRRIRQKKDFPALSLSITKINHLVHNNDRGASELSNVILNDYALTNKILKTVNSAYYSRYAGKINTISRAVIILGHDAIRSIAMTLLVIEHLRNKSQAQLLRNQTVHALLTGIIAEQTAQKSNMKVTEEAFICAMFRNLGSLLVTLYFHDEATEIHKLMVQNALTEEQASLMILGVSTQVLGQSVAKEWAFPDTIVASMEMLTQEQYEVKPITQVEQLQVLSHFANDVACLMAEQDDHIVAEKVEALEEKYQYTLNLSEKKITALMQLSKQELVKFTQVANIDVQDSPIFKNTPIHAIDDDSSADNTVIILENNTDKNTPKQEDVARHLLLADGLQDITSILLSDYIVNDVFRMILELMYRAMDFDNVLVFVNNAKSGKMEAQIGFGDGIDGMLTHFQFPACYQKDVFHIALDRGLDILIEDVRHQSVRHTIPAWFKKAISSHTFLLLPVKIKKVAIALFYVDKKTAGEINLTEKELNLLKALRNQGVLAIKQKLGK